MNQKATRMLDFDEARERVLEGIKRLEVEHKPILETLGQLLAEDIFAPEPNPPFDNSAMDGFAVRAQDLTSASQASPVRLQVVDSVAAGHVASEQVQSGYAIRIMTGATMPDGADAVVKVEDTRSNGADVEISTSIEVGENIRLTGESVQRGQQVLAQGTRIRAQELSMLASLNCADVPVYRRPVVAVLSTGDELTPLGQPLQPGKIRDSNRYGLYGQVLEAGGVPLDLGIVTDDADVLRQRVLEGTQQADALVTSGGVSVGDYDLVKQVLSSLGEINFWQVAMKPGKPQAHGFIQGKPVFGLPGNPVSSMVVFELFVRPSLRKMAGHAKLFRPMFEARLSHPLANDANRLNFMRAILSQDGNQVVANTTGPQGSGILHSLVLANGLIRLPPQAQLEAGDKVQAQWLE